MLKRPVIKHAIDTAVTMSFIAPGVFVSTIFLVDVVIDGVHLLAKKGMGAYGTAVQPREDKECVGRVWQKNKLELNLPLGTLG
jgi:hypothetical protein